MAKGGKSIRLLHHVFQEHDVYGLFGSNYQLPNYIQANLKDELRYYQQEALRYLHYSQDKAESDLLYNHLLFHMATGSGKTMVMAGVILYLFKEYGYQNFIFFVHTDAIIQKTKENLLNRLSSKYLFKQPLEIDGGRIYIEAVETFPVEPQKNTIYLKLSTIHKVHAELNSYKENSITYEDLKELRLVLLGDEAHHFNATTKSKTAKKSVADLEAISWESTVHSLLNLNPKNRLLEFTATINLDNKEILQKYKDKIIYQYDLKRFMMDGFSKKVMLLEANQSDEDKMLDAVLLSQYRKLIALDHGIHGFKPIVLFKSPQIAVSNRKQSEFVQIINSLTPEKISNYLSIKQGQLGYASSIWHKIIAYFKTKDLLSIVMQIQEDFNEMNLLNVNKQDILEEYPVLLNTLEEVNNPIRAVFAVAKVNEGWDVLNLYDIVRINEKASITKLSTDSEAQLIGRGARYYPFAYKNERSFIRRFDGSDSPLAILEQMHYHTINETSYIANLEKSLEHSDIVFDRDGHGVLYHAKLKDEFKKSSVYQQGSIYFNEVAEVKDHERSWGAYSLSKEFEINLQTIRERSLGSLSDANVEMQKLQTIRLDRRYWFKGLQRIQFFEFDNLKHYFPELLSISEFIKSEEFLAGININLKTPYGFDINNFSAKEKLLMVDEVLSRIADNLKRNYKKFRGTFQFVSKPLKDVFTDYSVYIDHMVQVNQRITNESSIGRKWYVYDNAILNQLEHRFVQLIGQIIERLTFKYDQIYLLRNDEKTTRFKLVEFGGVRGFMPDFLMILTNPADNSYYQVFLEPKGADRLLTDKWKEDMLVAINSDDIIILDGDEDENVRLIGIKFYSETASDSHASSSKSFEAFVKDVEDKLYDGRSLIDRSVSFEI